MDSLILRKNQLKANINLKENVIKEKISNTLETVKADVPSNLLKAGAATLGLGALNKSIGSIVTNDSSKPRLVSLLKILPIVFQAYKLLKK